jgi:O-antigen ligase
MRPSWRVPNVERVRLWEDGYGLLLFLCLFCLLGLAMQGLADVLMPFRWGFVTVAAGIGLWQLRQAGTIRLTGEHYCLMAMMLVGLASCAWSADPWYSIQRLGSFVLLWIAVFVGAWVWLRTIKNVILGANLFYLLVVLVTILSLFYLGQEQIVDRTERAEGAFGRATGAGTCAAMFIPVVVWRILYSRGVGRAVSVLVLIVQAYLLFFSGARLAIVAGVTGLAIVCWHQFRQYRVLMATMILILAGAVALGLIGLQSLPEYVVRQRSLSSLTGRTLRWELGLDLFCKHPLEGHGYGMSRYLVFMDRDTAEKYAQHEPNPSRAAFARRAAASGERVAYNLHSDHIERLVETGIFGYVGFGLFWVFLCWRGWRVLSAPSNPCSDLARLLLASVWLLWMDSLSHSILFAVGNGGSVLFWYVLVLFMAAERHAHGFSRRFDGRPPLARRPQGECEAEVGSAPTATANMRRILGVRRSTSRERRNAYR